MKIFGIGLSRTGTKTLSKALSFLGYKTGHYEAGIKSLISTNKGLQPNYSRIAIWDALTDIPSAAFFRELDKQYPGSKFILTVRDKQSWLDSCERHYSVSKSNYRKTHSIQEKTALQLRKLVYGIENFNREVFDESYDRHYRNIQLYFRVRRSDLLILNIIAGDAWGPLCRFLGHPIPNDPFPHENATKKPGANLHEKT